MGKAWRVTYKMEGDTHSTTKTFREHQQAIDYYNGLKRVAGRLQSAALKQTRSNVFKFETITQIPGKEPFLLCRNDKCKYWGREKEFETIHTTDRRVHRELACPRCGKHKLARLVRKNQCEGCGKVALHVYEVEADHGVRIPSNGRILAHTPMILCAGCRVDAEHIEGKTLACYVREQERTAARLDRKEKAAKTRRQRQATRLRKENSIMATATKTAAKAAPASALGVKEAAKALKTDPRTLRKFLRENNKAVGQGARYEFTKKTVESMRDRFNRWAGK